MLFLLCLRSKVTAFLHGYSLLVVTISVTVSCLWSFPSFLTVLPSWWWWSLSSSIISSVTCVLCDSFSSLFLWACCGHLTMFMCSFIQTPGGESLPIIGSYDNNVLIPYQFQNLCTIVRIEIPVVSDVFITMQTDQTYIYLMSSYETGRPLFRD